MYCGNGLQTDSHDPNLCLQYFFCLEISQSFKLEGGGDTRTKDRYTKQLLLITSIGGGLDVTTAAATAASFGNGEYSRNDIGRG
ncbi:hypothetical protein RJT34_30422 [Clitoria ternatea]|uniref:Uncharacterized protein n=1 Tax=Clitoria ternatea TaxID=43366 RepID=A0AAN9I7C4_CLITE